MCALRTDGQAIGCVKQKRFIPSQVMASWVVVSNPIFVNPGHASMDVWVGGFFPCGLSGLSRFLCCIAPDIVSLRCVFIRFCSLCQQLNVLRFL
jgi:hypothetical protein